jgi:hypothetical protein
VNGFVIYSFSHYVVEKGFFARNRKKAGKGTRKEREARKAALLLRRL